MNMCVFETDRQTDGQTDRERASVCVHMCVLETRERELLCQRVLVCVCVCVCVRVRDKERQQKRTRLGAHKHKHKHKSTGALCAHDANERTCARRRPLHSHRLPEGAAVGQAGLAEGGQVTATPVVHDVPPAGAPVRAHGGSLEGLRRGTGDRPGNYLWAV